MNVNTMICIIEIEINRKKIVQTLCQLFWKIPEIISRKTVWKCSAGASMHWPYADNVRNSRILVISQYRISWEEQSWRIKKRVFDWWSVLKTTHGYIHGNIEKEDGVERELVDHDVPQCFGGDDTKAEPARILRASSWGLNPNTQIMGSNCEGSERP